MSNMFGSLYIGSSGIRNSQSALNTTANNLANVSTTGYVREQVLFADEDYVTTGRASISKQQSGLGVSIADVVHARDIFLDQSYRLAHGRQSFYDTVYNTTSEVETYFQELDGEEFVTTLQDMGTALTSYAEDPSDETNQNLVIQKAGLFIDRAHVIYSQLQTYQRNVNTQVSDSVDKINKLAKTIAKINTQVQTIEAGGVETAMDLRDARDQALDELSKYGNITYSENPNGIVDVSFEGHELVLGDDVNTMGKMVDKATGFITPYWENSSTASVTDKVYDLTKPISAETNTDVGSLKALLISRGETIATYKDLLYNSSGGALTSDEYQNTIGSSILQNTEAEFDQLVHNVITTLNNIFAPNATSTYDSATTSGDLKDADGNVLYSISATPSSTTTYRITDASGNYSDIPIGATVLDTNTASTGKDGKLPPEELFTRNGMSRYTQYTKYDSSGTAIGVVYAYNEEDPTDSSSMYTLSNTKINDTLMADKTKLPCLKQNGLVNYDLGSALTSAWNQENWNLNPYDTTKTSFSAYYTNMISDIAKQGSIYASASDTMATSVTSISNQRQQVIGVSTDEELTNMIKFQNAYNAASRYINVLTTMMDSLFTAIS